METNSTVTNHKKSSAIENIGNFGMKIGEKLGKTVTEFFTGKPPTESEIKRRQRLRQLREAQEEAEFQKNMELARQGKYIPPEPKKVTKKNDVGDIFSNLGKYNPLDGFEKKTSLGSQDFGVEEYSSLKQRR